jgi:hypothetical protein
MRSGECGRSAGPKESSGGELRHFIAATLLLGCCAAVLRAQGNYEVQVYGSDLVAPNVTMVELHSNFTASGTKGVIDGVLPTNHAEHETVEITHGFDEWFECGFYFFTSIQPDGSWIAHPPAVFGAGALSPAGGTEHLQRNRLAAAQLFAGHLDLGDAADRR